MASAKKASPDYLKSRISTFLNPLFLMSLLMLGVIGVFAWQVISINNKFQPDSSSLDTPQTTVDNIEELNEPTGELNDSSSPQDLGQEPNIEAVSDNIGNTSAPVSPENNNQIGASEDIRSQDLMDIFGTDPIQTRRQENLPTSQGLFNQLRSLPLISPSVVSPNNGGINSGIVNAGSSPQRQSTATNNTNVTPSTGSTPLSQAVSQVMSRNNYTANTTGQYTPPQGQYYTNPVNPSVNVPSQPNMANNQGGSMINPGINNINSGFSGQVYQNNPPQNNQQVTPTSRSPF